MRGAPSLRLRILALFAGLAVCLLIVAALALVVLARGDDGSSDPLIQAMMIAVFGVVGAVTALWFLFDQHLARPLERLAGALRTGQAPDDTARHLGDLGPAARDAARARADADRALQQAIAVHAAEQQSEKSSLEAILADFGAGAVMTDAAGRVMFYNASAAGFLPGLALDRPLSGHLRTGALDAAQMRLRAGAPATDLACLTTQGLRLACRLRQMPEGQLLILRDRHVNRPAPRDTLEALRRHASALVPMLDALDGPIPPALAQAIRAEGQGLARTTRTLSQIMASDAPASTATLTEIAAGLPTAPDLPPVVFQADAAQVNALLHMLSGQLQVQGHDARIDLRPDHDGQARVALTWQGAPMAMDRLERWLSLAPDDAHPETTAEQILARHGTGIWAEADGDRARLVMPLTLAQQVPQDSGVTYDFALATRGVASGRLEDLTCVVFDTETTGLTDRDVIVQIAGLRLARGRLTGERFETLVNPGRPIPPSSTAIHGITDAMVRDAPDLTAALTAFRHFCGDDVLVALNAPFDMGFLRRAAGQTGAHFDNRVLDTVLLSAMVWGQSEEHSLDALTARLGITIPPQDRHTAMGDTAATAQAFLQLVQALQAMGITTFQDVQQQARRHRRLITDANLT
ncbi:exonuclease domain-containing protein [Paracoccus sp. R86501]|uniref:3'-5' exonuclease n=1 Tax=Paracoccus sp. R86501 TaxID=3101711 RepID=UPI003672D634